MLLIKRGRLNILLILFTLLNTNALAEVSPELRHFVTEDYKMDFHILLKPKKVKYADTLHYFWFKSQQLHSTQGYASGNLLHGSFTKFYYSGQLAEKGSFKYGLKQDKWITWNETGGILSVVNYNQGVLCGSFQSYSTSGSLVENGTYRKGRKKLKFSNKEKKTQRKLNRDKEDGNLLDEERPNFFLRLFKKDSAQITLNKAEREEKRAERRAKRKAKQDSKPLKSEND